MKKQGRAGGMRPTPPCAAHSKAAPLKCELTTQTPGLADLFCQLPSLTRVAGDALSFEAETMQAVLRTLNSLSAMSCMLR